MDCTICGTQNLAGVASCQVCGDTLMMIEAAAPPTDNLAIFSPVAFVAGWVAISVLRHIARIVLRHTARHEIAHSGDGQEGHELALVRLMGGYGRASFVGWKSAVTGVRSSRPKEGWIAWLS